MQSKTTKVWEVTISGVSNVGDYVGMSEQYRWACWIAQCKTAPWERRAPLNHGKDWASIWDRTLGPDVPVTPGLRHNDAAWKQRHTNTSRLSTIVSAFCISVRSFFQWNWKVLQLKQKMVEWWFTGDKAAAGSILVASAENNVIW